ncbi:MAG: amidase [Polyangiaceae bacterium]|jgi:Asp-tRNA(Asn)/Glu-tRNA(Gln) amidotransferase A subunit family amidase
MPYDLQTIAAPRLAGVTLTAAVTALENPVAAVALRPRLLRETGIQRLRKEVIEEPPSVVPPIPRPSTLVDSGAAPPLDLDGVVQGSNDGRGFRFESVADFARAYRGGQSDPERVGDALVAALALAETSSPPLRAITAFKQDEIRAQAKASAERFRRRQPLSVLDGVPVAVKEEFDVAGYMTTAGTSFLKTVADTDATVVARLRRAGALIYGKSNMHEIGIDVTGFNPHHGTPRNPYDPRCYTGGSSSGSAAAVAAGLGPLAVGADGGGSIRIPASLCGLVGLKATYGRVSEAGCFPLCWSVGHAGPIGATVRDVAIAYALMAGPDDRSPITLAQPPVRLDGLGQNDLDGVRLGVYGAWFEHAEPEVVSTCREMLMRLVGRGARIVEVEIPDLELARMAQGISFLCENATTMEAYDADHRQDLAWGSRLNLVLARALTGRDYVRAQQVRTRCFRHFERALASCDALVTPATGVVAPTIRADVMPRGESDLGLTSAMMRYVFASNLTGHPAISFPAGYDAAGLPVGLQAIGRPWEEHVLFRIAEVGGLELDRRAPKVHHRLLI